MMNEITQLKKLTESMSIIEEGLGTISQTDLANKFNKIKPGTGNAFIELLQYITLDRADTDDVSSEDTAILAVEEWQEEQFDKIVVGVYGMYVNNSKLYFAIDEEMQVTEAPIRTMNGSREITDDEFKNASINELQKYYQTIAGLPTSFGHQRTKTHSFSEWVAEMANRFGLDRL